MSFVNKMNDYFFFVDDSLRLTPLKPNSEFPPEWEDNPDDFGYAVGVKIDWSKIPDDAEYFYAVGRIEVAEGMQPSDAEAKIFLTLEEAKNYFLNNLARDDDEYEDDPELMSVKELLDIFPAITYESDSSEDQNIVYLLKIPIN